MLCNHLDWTQFGHFLYFQLKMLKLCCVFVSLEGECTVPVYCAGIIRVRMSSGVEHCTMYIYTAYLSNMKHDLIKGKPTYSKKKGRL